MLSSRATRMRNAHARLIGRTVRLSRGSMAWLVVNHNPARSVYTLESVHTHTRHCEPANVLRALIASCDITIDPITEVPHDA